MKTAVRNSKGKIKIAAKMHAKNPKQHAINVSRHAKLVSMIRVAEVAK